jgi:hypothetical protein
MWATLITEITTRILAARTYFSAVAALPAAETAAKGFAFVQLYAIYEFAVCSAVRAAWIEINAHAPPLHSIRLEMMGAALDAELRAVMDCNVERQWETRMGLFRKVNSADPFVVLDTFFPSDGSHYRVKQLQTIWDLFGIAGHPLPAMPLMGLINLELVEHRNAIAHGRKTAEEIGRSYTIAEIHQKINQTQNLCLHVVNTMQAHCSNPANFAR